MSKTKKLLVLGGIAAAAISMAATATTALADPPTGVTPRHTDIVGTGSDTTQLVMDQLATHYDAGLTASARHVYSFDAVDPSDPTAPNQTITEKNGCGVRTRPNGSGAGVTELKTNLRPSGDKTDYCVDFARSSSGRSATDNTILYLPFAIDGVTWSADTLTGKTNAPTTMPTQDLTAIYSCNASLINSSYPDAPVTWKEVGGSGQQKIIPVIPQSSSGTRKFFLQKINVSTLGNCVQGQDNSVEENEGTNAIFQNSTTAPNIVFPYSIAVYLAQSQHNHGAGNQGHQVLKRVLGVSPTVGTGTNTKINSNFPYLREVYNVVRNTPAAQQNNTQAVPTYLQAFFGSGSVNTGWVCKNLKAKTDVESFGFLPDPNCGSIQ